MKPNVRRQCLEPDRAKSEMQKTIADCRGTTTSRHTGQNHVGSYIERIPKDVHSCLPLSVPSRVSNHTFRLRPALHFPALPTMVATTTTQSNADPIIEAFRLAQECDPQLTEDATPTPSVASGPAPAPSSVWTEQLTDWTETASNAPKSDFEYVDNPQPAPHPRQPAAAAAANNLPPGQAAKKGSTEPQDAISSSGPKVCKDCKERHLPRRLVLCVDGTLGTPGGVVGVLRGNGSNVYRIRAVSREGRVTDLHGKEWNQIPKYFPGVGADEKFVSLRSIAAVTGLGPTGFQKQIRDVYRVGKPHQLSASASLQSANFILVL